MVCLINIQQIFLRYLHACTAKKVTVIRSFLRGYFFSAFFGCRFKNSLCKCSELKFGKELYQGFFIRVPVLQCIDIKFDRNIKYDGSQLFRHYGLVREILHIFPEFAFKLLSIQQQVLYASKLGDQL